MKRENGVQKRIVFDLLFKVASTFFNKRLPFRAVQKRLELSNRLERAIIKNAAKHGVVGNPQLATHVSVCNGNDFNPICEDGYAM